MGGETKGVSQRQRFYVELKPGQTVTVSWKKLLRDSQENVECPCVDEPVMDPFCGPHLHEMSTPSRALDGRFEGVLCSEYKNSFTSSGHKQQRIVVERTSTKGANNKRRRMKNMSSKADRETSVMVKDHQLDIVKAFAGDAMTSMKNVAGNSNKHRCPAYLNAVLDASVSPLKTKLSNLPKVEKVYFKRRKMEVGLKRNPSDSGHEKAKSIPLQNNHRCKGLMDGNKVGVSSKSQHNDKSCQRKELVNVVSHGFGSPWKHLVSMKGQKAMIQSERRTENDVNKTSSSTSHKLITPAPSGIAARKTCSFKQNLSKGRNTIEANPTSHVKGLKQEQAPKKANVGIRFSLKSQPGTRTQ